MYKICLAHFPYAEAPNQTKYRPVLCLSKPNSRFNLVVTAAISRQVPKAPCDTELVIHHEGLKDASVIRLHRLASLPLDAVIEELGVLSAADSRQVQQKLGRLFQLAA